MPINKLYSTNQHILLGIASDQLKQLKKEQMKALSKIIDADNHLNEDWVTTK